jgi:very-short-patch-repair endonuclease
MKTTNIMFEQLFNKPEMKERRRALRKRMTPAEVAFWSMIRKRQLEGKRFLRQYSVGYYIVDFCCPEHKLVIELDGEVHNSEEAKAYDAARTLFLESVGFTVLRFENLEVFDYPERTLDEIRRYLK